MISLGCDKNLVDSEVMLSIIIKDGHTITQEESDAETIVVNTCCFIKSAAEESIENILALAENKTNGRCKHLIITGCIAERYRNEIFKEIPEADAVIGTADYESIGDVINRLSEGEKNIAELGRGNTGAVFERSLTAPNHYASLKIAEGCDNHCTYCIIPKLRGRYKSREINGLVAETEMLAEAGVSEIMLVAQDTAVYGTDLYGEPRITELIEKISAVGGIEWIRLLYAYPEHMTEKIIGEIYDNPKVCRYIDMPVQHADDSILKLMGRKTTRASLTEKICALREKAPDICIRSTIMTGFPGETEEAFFNLTQFIREVKFDRLGVFAYSREDGTPAYNLPNQIKEGVKQKRRNACLKIQKEISKEKMSAMIGKTLRVIVDGKLADDNIYCGRSYMDSPDVDGMVFFPCPYELLTGTFADVKITGSSDYDLYGDIV